MATYLDSQGNPSSPAQSPAAPPLYLDESGNPIGRNTFNDAVQGLKDGAKDVAKGSLESIMHPLNAIAGIWHGMKSEADTAATAYNKGDLEKAINHTVGVFPVLGPAFSSVLDSINDPNVDLYETGRRVGRAVTMEIAPDVVNGAAKVVSKAVDVAPAVTEGVKAGAKAAAPDLAMGAAKTAAGATVAEMLPGGPIRYVAGAAPVYAGVRQMGKGLSKGYAVGSAAYNAARAAQQAPDIPATATATSPAAQTAPQAPIPAPVVEAAPAVTREMLDSIAAQMGYRKGFGSVPPDGQQLITNLAQAALKAPVRQPAPVIQFPSPPAQAPSTPAAVVPPASSTMRNGAPVAEQLRDLLAPGTQPGEGGVATINPAQEAEAIDPEALKAMMRDLPPGAPKAIARANYAADQEPKQAAAVYEAAGRAAKSQNLSQMLYDEGISAQKVSKWSGKAWDAAASDQGMPQFSKQSQGEVIQALRKLEGKVKK